MAQTVTNASPATIGIAYSASATTYYDATVSWTKPGSAYRMTGLQLAFTTNNSGYYVYVMHRVNGASSGIGTYNSTQAAGAKEISLPQSAWSSLTGDSLTLRFRRPQSNAQTYSDIRLIVSYESVASASTATAADAVAGEAQTVNITNTDSTVTHEVTWQYGSVSGSTFTSLVSSGAQAFGASTRSPAWAVPSASLSSLYSANPDRTTIPGRVTVKTLTSDGTNVGSVTVSCELTIPNSDATKPTLSVSMSASGDAVAEAAEADYVQNHTTLQLTPTAAGQAGASVTGIRVETPAGTVTADSGAAVSIPLRTAGTCPITVIATDSRGYTSVWTTTLTVAECAAPIITEITAVRCNNDGTANDEGAYVSVAATASITGLAEVDNWTYQLRQTGSSTVLAEGALPGGAGVIGGELDKDSTYIVTVTVTDSLGQTATASENIGSAIYTIYRMAGGKGIAFGKVADKYGMEVNEDWPLYTHGMEILQLIVDAAHPVGSVIQTADASWNPNVVWPWTTWVLLKDVFLRASGSQDVLATGGAASAQIPGQSVSVPAQSVTLTPGNLPIYTVYARKSNASSTNYNGYESAPVSEVGYRAHAVGSNSETGSDLRYVFSNQQATAVTVPGQDVQVPAQSVDTLPPYLVVNVWVRVRNPGDALPAGTLSGIIGGVGMSGGSGGEGYSSLLAVFARNIGNMESEIQRVDEERADMLEQFENLVKYSDLTEEYSASVIGGRLNGPNLIVQPEENEVFSQTMRSFAYSYPYIRNATGKTPATAGDEPDEISETLVPLTGANIVTDEAGTSYTTAVAFTVTNAPVQGWGNADDLVFNYGNTSYRTSTPPANIKSMTGQLDMEVGETYTLSCWARVTSGSKAMLHFMWSPERSFSSTGVVYDNQTRIEISNTAWKRIEWTFVFNPTGPQTYTYNQTVTEDGVDTTVNYTGFCWLKKVAIGVCRKYNGTVQLCGFRLVKGLTNWVEEQHRATNAAVEAMDTRVTDLESRVTALENAGS
ncbi:MAG: hypothetical protein IKE04_02795 [Oscillospiraceae bacterium]|nr:hypothetical protein [Oscillospiraceae bacterium]